MNDWKIRHVRIRRPSHLLACTFPPAVFGPLGGAASTLRFKISHYLKHIRANSSTYTATKPSQPTPLAHSVFSPELEYLIQLA